MSIHRFLKLSELDQRMLLARANEVMPLAIESFEKDIFVCLFLDNVMAVTGKGQQGTREGGR